MKPKRKGLETNDRTKNLCFSLYPTTVKSLRGLSGEWGSVGRAIQVAVEILVDRLTPSAQEIWEQEMSGKKPRVRPLEGPGLVSDEERGRQLKVPFSFSVPERTEEQIEWLSDAERYKNRNEVIFRCEGLLADLSVRHSGGSKTSKKR